MIVRGIRLFLICFVIGFSVAHAQTDEPDQDSLYAIPTQSTKGTIVRIGSHITIGEGMTCRRVIAIGSNLIVSGEVSGDIVAVMADVVINKTAVIEGELVSVSGSLKVDPEARISGTVTRLSTIQGVSALLSTISGVPRKYWGNVPWISWKIVSFVFMLLFQIILFAIFPRNVENMARSVAMKPLGSALLGLIIMLLVIPVSLMLILSVVGIPLFLVLWSLLVIGAIFGKIGLFIALIWPLVRSDKISLSSVVIGYSVYRLLTLLPVVGKPLFLIMTLLSVGVCARTLFGIKQVHRKKYYTDYRH